MKLLLGFSLLLLYAFSMEDKKKMSTESDIYMISRIATINDVDHIWDIVRTTCNNPKTCPEFREGGEEHFWNDVYSKETLSKQLLNKDLSYQTHFLIAESIKSKEALGVIAMSNWKQNVKLTNDLPLLIMLLTILVIGFWILNQYFENKLDHEELFIPIITIIVTLIMAKHRSQETCYHLKHFWVKFPGDGSGCGSFLWNGLMSYVNQRGIEKFTLNSSTYAVNIYKHYGCRQIHEQKEKNGLVFVPMIWEKKKISYLETTNLNVLCLVTNYLSITEIVVLHRVSKALYQILNGENFPLWLRNNRKIFDQFFKPLMIPEFLDRGNLLGLNFDFTLDCPHGELIKQDDPWNQKYVARIEICGCVEIYTKAWLSKSQPDLPVEQHVAGPVLQKRCTSVDHPVISIKIDKDGKFIYEFYNDAIESIPDSGLRFVLTSTSQIGDWNLSATIIWYIIHIYDGKNNFLGFTDKLHFLKCYFDDSYLKLLKNMFARELKEYNENQ